MMTTPPRHTDEFLAPRRCLREPLPEHWKIAELLERAADAHLANRPVDAASFLRAANSPILKEWTQSLWGTAKATPHQWQYLRVRPVPDTPPRLPKHARVPVRHPNSIERAAIIARYGQHCAFCGVPLISVNVRKLFHTHYPEAAPWDGTTATQHAGLEALWLQFDHVLPHSRGGDNSVANVVPTCAGCNYGRSDNTLAENGLIDPRTRPARLSDWDGLERVFTATSEIC